MDQVHCFALIIANSIWSSIPRFSSSKSRFLVPSLLNSISCHRSFISSERNACFSRWMSSCFSCNSKRPFLVVSFFCVIKTRVSSKAMDLFLVFLFCKSLNIRLRCFCWFRARFCFLIAFSRRQLQIIINPKIDRTLMAQVSFSTRFCFCLKCLLLPLFSHIRQTLHSLLQLVLGPH